MTGSNSAYPLFTSNFVLQASSRFHHWEGDGPLSIKTFSNGRAFYKVNRGYFAVEEEAYLLLNERQAYTISIESPTKVDSFCIFFKRNFAEETFRALQTEPSRLLDDPFLADATPVEFYEKTYTNDLLLTLMWII
jgi:AraC family transcriptional regulator